MTEWRDIPGTDGLYQASVDGQIRSKRHLVPNCGLRGGVVLKVQYNVRHAYPSVRIRIDGKKATKSVHNLVALTFLGPRKEGQQIRHLDGNRSNSAAANLAYGTQSENMRDAVRHGTHPQASKSTCIHGHPFTEANTYTHNGGRHCRTCSQRRNREYRARKANVSTDGGYSWHFGGDSGDAA